MGKIRELSYLGARVVAVVEIKVNYLIYLKKFLNTKIENICVKCNKNES